ncbi:MAG: dihydroflavonol-4-reductase [Rhodothermales bacterium]|jgi:dihydroflavonol-4-reductase
MSRTLVTGATGFLGAHLVRILVGNGEAVRVLIRSPKRMDILNDVADQVEIVQGDVRDFDDVQDALVGVDRVFHCAAFVGFGGRSESDVMMDVNVGGTRTVVDAALSAGVERVVHTSSIAALGRTENSTGCLDETATWAESVLNTAYAVSKHLAELEVHRAVAEGLDAVIVNPSLVMGPGRAGENTLRIAERIRDRKLPVMPSGATNVVDVEDVVKGHVAAMERGRSGERYILAGQNLPWTEIIGTLAHCLGVESPRRILSMRAGLIAGGLSELLSKITRKSPLLTRESARISCHRSCYLNDKACTELGLSFRPFTEIAERMAHSLGQ